MRTKLHLVSMPWSDPELPSIQIGALKAYVDSVFERRVPTRTYSAFASICLEEKSSGLINQCDRYEQFEEYPYFLMLCGQRLSTQRRRGRVIEQLIAKLNRTCADSLTLRQLAHLERRTQRYITDRGNMAASFPDSFEIRVRQVSPDDRDFILALAGRLAEFGPPPWRTSQEIVSRERQVLAEFFERPPAGAAMLIATSRNGQQRLGYAYLESHEDYFTAETWTHVSTLAIAAQFEGRHVAGALLSAAEDLARSRGAKGLSLNVFEGNLRARRIYERRGFKVETLHYVKPFN